MKKYAFKEELTSDDIKNFRELNNLTRSDLADLLNVSKRTVEGWEISNKKIYGPITSLLRIFNEYPEYIEKYRIPKKEYPLRLYYMENSNINTIIDVDITRHKVKIKNFTNNLLDRAFGPKEEVTYEEYEEFLESRCFPRTRDKMKIQLEMIGIPFYDPMLIIEKTKGRMAEDNYYIEIERGLNK